MTQRVESPEYGSASDLTLLLSILNELELLVEQGHGLMGVKLITKDRLTDLLECLRQTLPGALFELDAALQEQTQFASETQEQAYQIVQRAKKEATSVTELARQQATQRIENAQAQRQHILSEAARQSQAIQDEAARRSAQLVQIHPTVVRAQQTADELREAARKEATELRAGADAYGLEVMEKAEAAFSRLHGRVREGQALLRPNMNDEGRAGKGAPTSQWP